VSALAAEWVKLRTAPAAGGLLLAAAAVTVAVSTLTIAAASCPAAGCGQDPGRLTLTGVDVAQAVVAVLGVRVIGEEYGTGMIRVTLAATPGRLRVLAAKAVTAAGAALAAGAVAVAGSLLGGRLILPGRGLTTANGYVPVSLVNGPDLRAALGTVLYLALIALLALGVATAVRDSAVGAGLVLGLLFLFPLVTAVIPDPVLARHLEQIAPMTAGLFIQVTVGTGTLPLTPWQGLGVTALWAAGALVVGGAVLRLRDA
jgi:ABC-2 type transport system permease protein